MVEPSQEQTNLAREVKKYVDPLNGLSARGLKLGYWLETHKSAFARGVLFFILAIDAILIIFSLYRWGEFLWRGIGEQRDIIQELAAPGVAVNPRRQEQMPAELQVLSNTVLFTGNDRYDFVVEMVNPNPKWLVSFDYRFVFRGGETDWRRTFLLPGENTVRGELGFVFGVRPREAQLELDNIKWQRVSAHLTPDPVAYVADHARFTVAGAEMVPAGGGSTGGIGGGASVRFSITNNTPYSFWEVPLLIVLSGAGISGVETATLAPFKSGETQVVSVATSAPASTATAIRVLPVIDIFDTSVYMPPGDALTGSAGGAE